MTHLRTIILVALTALAVGCALDVNEEDTTPLSEQEVDQLVQQAQFIEMGVVEERIERTTTGIQKVSTAPITIGIDAYFVDTKISCTGTCGSGCTVRGCWPEGLHCTEVVCQGSSCTGEASCSRTVSDNALTEGYDDLTD